MLHAIIMAGGSGTRFWPQSRKRLPKQFLNITGERSLIQQTAARCDPWISPERMWVVTNALLADETKRQLPEIPMAHILIEPCGRNTAPCIGLAAIQLLTVDPEATMLVMPADHVISPDQAFRVAVERAVALVEANPELFVLFGVDPTYPATGFGYMERGEPLPSPQNHLPESSPRPRAFRVGAFREKPDLATAENYFQSGNFVWNCGIFVWKAAAILEALRKFEPEIHAKLQDLIPTVGTPEWTSALEAEFPQMPSISIDYAVLERAPDVCVLEAPFEWDDVGSWQALSRLIPPDDQGNTIVGLHVGVDTRGCIIRGSDDHLIATIGVEDCIIVHTPTATLVARKNDESSLRRLIARLQELGFDEYL